MRTTAILVLAAAFCATSHGDQKSKSRLAPVVFPPPTEAQMREAYDASAKRLVAMSKYPPATKIFPVETAWFRIYGRVAGDDVVIAYITMDSQNVYGAMVRGTGVCKVNAAKSAVLCDVIDGDLVALGMVSKDMMVQIPKSEK